MHHRILKLNQLILDVSAKGGQMSMFTASRITVTFSKTTSAQSTGMVRHATAGSRSYSAVLQGCPSTWIWCSRS